MAGLFCVRTSWEMTGLTGPIFWLIIALSLSENKSVPLFQSCTATGVKCTGKFNYKERDHDEHRAITG